MPATIVLAFHPSDILAIGATLLLWVLLRRIFRRR